MTRKPRRNDFDTRWPNFTAGELSCKHCGEYYHWPQFLDRLQDLRNNSGALRINSGHRCGLHNARVGGSPFSEHLKLAVDIDLKGHNRIALLAAAKRAKFSGFGLYVNFLHIDLGRPRVWASKRARELWRNY